MFNPGTQHTITSVLELRLLNTASTMRSFITYVKPSFCSGILFSVYKPTSMCIEIFPQEIVKIWMNCGKRLLSSKAFASMSIECFTLAQTFLPSNDSGKLQAKISYSRAAAILTVNESTQLAQAIKDVNAYVEQYPTSVKVIKV